MHTLFISSCDTEGRSAIKVLAPLSEDHIYGASKGKFMVYDVAIMLLITLFNSYNAF